MADAVMEPLPSPPPPPKKPKTPKAPKKARALDLQASEIQNAISLIIRLFVLRLQGNTTAAKLFLFLGDKPFSDLTGSEFYNSYQTLDAKLVPADTNTYVQEYKQYFAAISRKEIEQWQKTAGVAEIDINSINAIERKLLVSHNKLTLLEEEEEDTTTKSMTDEGDATAVSTTSTSTIAANPDITTTTTATPKGSMLGMKRKNTEVLFGSRPNYMPKPPKSNSDVAESALNCDVPSIKGPTNNNDPNVRRKHKKMFGGYFSRMVVATIKPGGLFDL